MARTPALSVDEAEAACVAAYGPRAQTISAHSRITAETRGPIRAWLTAQGIPSDVARGLSLTLLRDAWTDTTGACLAALRRIAAEGPTNTTTQEPATVQALDLRSPTRREPPTIEHEPEPARAPIVSAMPTDTNAAAAQIGALLAQLAGTGAVNPEQVRAIVAEAFDARRLPTAEEVAGMVAAAVAESVKPITIEIRAADGAVRALAGIAHPMLPKLIAAAQAVRGKGGMGVWIAGPTGSGKTHAVKQTAEALSLPFHHNGALADPYALLGYQDAGGTYHDTAFRRAYEHGGAYCFDEVDASDNAALLALNGALANGACTFPDGAVNMHPDFICVATANTWGMGATAEFVGRSRIDAAFKSRFPVRLAWGYDEGTERALAGNDAWCDRVQRARRRAAEAGLKVIIDPRTTYAGSALITSGMTADEAAEVTYLADLAPAQRQQVGG